MSRSTLRLVIIVLTLATVGIHWYLVLLQGIPAGIPFFLNGLGYLVLMGAVAFNSPRFPRPGPRPPMCAIRIFWPVARAGLITR